MSGMPWWWLRCTSCGQWIAWAKWGDALGDLDCPTYCDRCRP